MYLKCTWVTYKICKLVLNTIPFPKRYTSKGKKKHIVLPQLTFKSNSKLR